MSEIKLKINWPKLRTSLQKVYLEKKLGCFIFEENIFFICYQALDLLMWPFDQELSDIYLEGKYRISQRRSFSFR